MHRMKARVLLSTYNGRANLDALIESLENQVGSRPRIIVRDDGSTDGTAMLLQDYASRGVLEFQTGQNLGASASYFELLLNQSGEDIVFLADQDDIWNTDKIQRARAALSKIPDDVPALYCGRVEIIDNQLISRGFSPLWPKPPSFENALVENIAMGCTIALNRKATELLRSRPAPVNAVMHDWWCYLVVSAFGQVIFDPAPVMRYRIHGANSVGLSTERLPGIIARIQRQLRSSTLSQCAKQVAEFKELYAIQLSTNQIDLIDRILATNTLRGRLEFMSEHRISRQFRTDDIILKLLAGVRGVD